MPSSCEVCDRPGVGCNRCYRIVSEMHFSPHPLDELIAEVDRVKAKPNGDLLQFPRKPHPGAFIAGEDSIFETGAEVYTGQGVEAGEGFALTWDEINEMYPSGGNLWRKKPVGKPLARTGKERIVMGGRGWDDLKRPVFSSPVVLRESTNLRWASKRMADAFLANKVGPKAVWSYTKARQPWFKDGARWYKLTLFYGNVAALHHHIKQKIADTGDYHHLYAEVIDLQGRVNVGDRIYPVYEIFLGS